MNIAIVMAGGQGTRMSMKDMPKQFIDVCGKPVIIHTLEKFDRHPEIDYIAVVCIKNWQSELKTLIEKFKIKKVKWIITGGETRQESVFNALNSLNGLSGDDIVLIHDAARPFITEKIISDNIKAALTYGAVGTVIPAADTIIKSMDGVKISDVPNRKELYLVQTPQSFKFSIIKEAHEAAVIKNVDNATDDCQLVLKSGIPVHLAAGNKLNFKITTREDLLLFKAVMEMV
ncbi:MAG: 2-C-methyl-D-erythritol 4-phosphate cytidylyltransferase [Bacillota bacterium]|nr:2-C-methyl-D-erythritol 4-phosphate cytidylyltransferase [Bacillota bacterium]